MSAAVIGNVLGRLLASYLIVWTLMWLAVARRDWRGAFRCTGSWYGVTAVLLTFSLGVLTTVDRVSTM